ncbi:MAG: hypothetical protein HY393_01195 [Candidatus Diapherotrites archaeon]|nr:hypothetical protein [Candidatus Diapherotrites archaeon]
MLEIPNPIRILFDYLSPWKYFLELGIIICSIGAAQFGGAAISYQDSLDSTANQSKYTYGEIQILIEDTSDVLLSNYDVIVERAEKAFSCTNEKLTLFDINTISAKNYCDLVGYSDELGNKEGEFKKEVLVYNYLIEKKLDTVNPTIDSLFQKSDPAKQDEIKHSARVFRIFENRYLDDLKHRINTWNKKENSLKIFFQWITFLIIIGFIWAFTCTHSEKNGSTQRKGTSENFPSGIFFVTILIVLLIIFYREFFYWVFPILSGGLSTLSGGYALLFSGLIGALIGSLIGVWGISKLEERKRMEDLKTKRAIQIFTPILVDVAEKTGALQTPIADKLKLEQWNSIQKDYLYLASSSDVHERINNYYSKVREYNQFINSLLDKAATTFYPALYEVTLTIIKNELPKAGRKKYNEHESIEESARRIGKDSSYFLRYEFLNNLLEKTILRKDNVEWPKTIEHLEASLIVANLGIRPVIEKLVKEHSKNELEEFSKSTSVKAFFELRRNIMIEGESLISYLRIRINEQAIE